MVQQLMFPGIGTEGSSFKPVDRPDYGIAAELLFPFGDGSKSQVSQGLYGLRSTYCGFASTEIDRHKLHLPDLGVPHPVLVGMTAAEVIALYIGIDQLKNGKLKVDTANNTPACISELVQGGFRTSPVPLRKIAEEATVGGYDTGRGGLVQRMRQVLSTEPQLGESFRETALSTIIANGEDIKYIRCLDFGDLVKDLACVFASKYSKAEEVRAAQAVAARK